MNGFLNLYKPTGRTSSDAVVFVRRRLPKGTAVGHGGTLDPEASGVLPVCVGSATRLFDYIIDKQKTYVARLQLGVETDTQDATGQVVAERPVTVGEAELRAVLGRFVGEIEQVPPMYSALKRDGRRLYQLARRGQSVALEPRRCRVDAVEYLGREGEDLYAIKVRCGKGVYIRTLCHDIGQALGCGAHMRALERTEAGIFRIEDALSLEDVDALASEDRLGSALIPLDAPLGHLPAVRVGERCRHAVLNGNPLRAEWLDAPAPQAGAVRVYLGEAFAGVGAPQPDGSVRFRAMLYKAGDGA
ncbi:MAG: tRNA pseudouridine(55) synthase TruB [Clostridia bacterium]|nr:tRNA pseudouridine(55) synthase TruB [Clostridia bacterium]